MARRVKCPYCETYLDKDDAIPYKKDIITSIVLIPGRWKQNIGKS